MNKWMMLAMLCYFGLAQAQAQEAIPESQRTPSSARPVAASPPVAPVVVVPPVVPVVVAPPVVLGPKTTVAGPNALTTSSTTGISTNQNPQWVLVADASATSIDFEKPVGALGLERSSPYTTARVVMKKNLADSSVEANRGSEHFGQSLLAPALANFGFVARFEFRPRGSIFCDDCDSPNRFVHTKSSYGFYGHIETSRATFSIANTDVAEKISPFSLAVGLTYRLEGSMPDGAKLGTSKLAFAPYVGFSGRAVGDGSEADRSAIFGTDARYYAGFEAGIFVQFGNIILEPKLTYLTNKEDRIPGLTGLQPQINMSFELPWSVLGGK